MPPIFVRVNILLECGYRYTKMKCKFFLLTILISNIFFAVNITAQDTLPRFNVKTTGNNKIIIGWVNNFDDVKQISIQRSFDSLTGYKTILTVADPTTKENGYVDAKASNDHMFYRLYILRDKGNYLFSKAQRPIKDTIKIKNAATITRLDTIYEKVVKNGDTVVVTKVVPFTVVLGKIPFSDSSKTPDLSNAGKTKPNAFTPSLFVYTERDGYVRITLPEEDKPKNYSIKFFDEENNLLFELKEVKEKTFKLDKTNFYHAGWFKFELYEENKLIEKHKFYLAKDF
jgi:hypothetical protein